MQSLLDLFEENLNLPSASVQISHSGRAPFKVIGQFQPITDIIQTDTVGELRKEQTDHMTPRCERVRFLFSVCFPSQLRRQMRRNYPGIATQVLTTPHLESAKPGFVDRMICQQYVNAVDWVATFEKAARKFTKILVLGG